MAIGILTTSRGQAAGTDVDQVATLINCGVDDCPDGNAAS